MERNVELLEKTMQFIKDNPDLHDQSNWCGTSQCFAGWAAQLSGWHQAGQSMAIVQRGDEALPVRTVAMRELGLDDDEASILFDMDRSCDELELLVKDLVDGNEIRQQRDYSPILSPPNPFSGVLTLGDDKSPPESTPVGSNDPSSSVGV